MPVFSTRFAAALLLPAACALSVPAAAAPATYWTGVRVSSQLSHTVYPPGLPPTTVQDNHHQTLYPIGANDPLRGTDLSARVHSEIAAIGLGGDASAQAQMGVLKAWSQVEYRGPQGASDNHFGSSLSWASFGDTIAVTGLGLVAGAAVTYTVDIDIHALFQQLLDFPGYGLYANADLVVAAEDTDTGVQRMFTWNAGLPPTGLAGGHFRWDYQTAVGRSFVLSAYLNTMADHSHPRLGTVSADLGHTVRLTLDNADARLNTVGLSGHDFGLNASTDPDPRPLPTPASAALVVLALALLGARRSTGSGKTAPG